MNLLSLLTGALTSDASMTSISGKTGVSSGLTKKLLLLAIPMILKNLTKNSASAEGASSLKAALGQHTSKQTLAEQIAEADTEDGGKILGHVFGSDQQTVMNNLAQQSGMDAADVSNVLSSIAPALLSSLSATTSAGAAAQQSGGASSVDFSDMMSIFGGGSQGASDNLSADVLGSLFQPAKPAKPSGLGGLLAGLFGGGQKEDTAASGADLLSALLSLR